MKEIKDDITRWRNIPFSWWVGGINIVKKTILPNAIYRFNMNSIKLPMTFLTELEKKKSQCVWKHKRPWVAKTVLRKKNGAGEESTFLTSDYTTKLRHQDRVVLAQKQKYRWMEQDKKPRNKLTHLWTPYFWQRKQWAKDSLFIKWCW